MKDLYWEVVNVAGIPFEKFFQACAVPFPAPCNEIFDLLCGQLCVIYILFCFLICDCAHILIHLDPSGRNGDPVCAPFYDCVSTCIPVDVVQYNSGPLSMIFLKNFYMGWKSAVRKRHFQDQRSLHFFRNATLKTLAGLILFFPFFLSGNPAELSEQGPLRRFNWPIEKGKYPDLYGITSTFGESRSDHFHTGLDIAGLNLKVSPIAEGQVLFNRQVSHDPYRPTPGAGNYAILNHGKGVWSGYFHLIDTMELKKTSLAVDDFAGIAGNTGHSYGAHLHFFITEDRGQTYINPLTVLPPITDRFPPTIGQLVVQTSQGTTLISHRREENIRLTRSYPFQVVINDAGFEPYTRRGIYTLRWSVNGSATGKRVFDTITLTEEGWLLDQTDSYNEVFSEEIRVISGMKYNLGMIQLSNGNNTIEVTATDFSGNESTVTYTINVNREY